jgi:hypothetical protein
MGPLGPRTTSRSILPSPDNEDGSMMMVMIMMIMMMMYRTVDGMKVA